MISRSNDLCPVCDMKVLDSDFVTNFSGIYYHFCSLQCLENFNKRPLLYSKKNRPDPQIKNRTLRFSESLDTKSQTRIRSELNEMMGVTALNFKNKRLLISYDLLQINEKFIVDKLLSIGLKLNNGLFDRIKRSWTNNLEENELDNLAAPPGACCNRAPPRRS